MTQEECVVFSNAEGHLLRGILHRPDPVNRRRISLIALNTGLNDMVGWHRLQLKIGRCLVENGYSVLRFDNFGIGDSEGEIEAGEVVEIFNQIEQGLWARDAISAVDFMCSELRNEKCVFIGFCGGALNAVHAGAMDPRVAGVVNVAGPFTLTTNTIAKRLDEYNVQSAVTSYKSKLINIESVINFFSGKSDYNRLCESLLYYAKYKLMKIINGRQINQRDPIELDNINHLLLKSYESYLKSKRPLLFYYAEHDKATWELMNYFLPKYQDTGFWHAGCEVIELEKSNHIFSGERSQKSIVEDILVWLKKTYD